MVAKSQVQFRHRRVTNPERETNRRVAVRLPPWLARNDILQFTGEAELRATAVDASTYRWEVETRESYEHQSPGLMQLEPLASPGQPTHWEVLSGIVDPGVTHSITLEQLTAERDRILSTRRGNFTAIAAALKLMVSSVGHSDLPQAARDSYDALAALKHPDGSTIFPEVRADFIRVSPGLAKRLALARVLMRIEEEPDLLVNKPDPAPGTTAFGSAWHHSSDLYLTRDAYLAPLYLAASPWVWCVPCPRVPGVILYNLGACIVGRMGEAAEPLQLFFPVGTLASGPSPAIREPKPTRH